jgi:hypothetical protein
MILTPFSIVGALNVKLVASEIFQLQHRQWDARRFQSSPRFE